MSSEPELRAQGLTLLLNDAQHLGDDVPKL